MVQRSSRFREARLIRDLIETAKPFRDSLMHPSPFSAEWINLSLILDSLPNSEDMAAESIESIEAGLNSFWQIAGGLRGKRIGVMIE